MEGNNNCTTDRPLDYTELTLPVGQIRGALRKTIYDDTYYSFEGIPYGEPPVDELRFRAPRPARSWQGVKICTATPSIPLQKNLETGKVMGSEDCLNLNVYVKRLKSVKTLPVLVWIYGGGFNTGQATRHLYSPDYFMTQNVVVVTLNYRLCSLGFLSVNDPELQIPGNAGLKDQLLALKWIRKHISHFNGDANNITLCGLSSGSCCVQYLMCMPQAQGLFHKAICMGGSMLNPWSCPPPKDNAYRLAQLNGYEGNNNDHEVVHFLQSLEAEKLVSHNLLTTADILRGRSSTFAPCVEPYNGGVDCVIPLEPREMLKTAWGNSIPLIMGASADEGLLLRPFVTDNPFRDDPVLLLPDEVREMNEKDRLEEMAQKILHAHVGDEKPQGRFCQKTIDFYSIFMIWHGIHRTLLARLAYATAPTYHYHFAFDSATFAHPRRRFCGEDLTSGVAHGDEISYIWYGDYAWKMQTQSREYKMIEAMIGICTNFMEYSHPGIDNWLPLDGNNPNDCFNIADDMQMMLSPKSDLLQVWDTLYDANKLF